MISHNVQKKSNSSWSYELWDFDQLHQTFHHNLEDASCGAGVTLCYISTVEKNKKTPEAQGLRRHLVPGDFLTIIYNCW